MSHYVGPVMVRLMAEDTAFRESMEQLAGLMRQLFEAMPAEEARRHLVEAVSAPVVGWFAPAVEYGAVGESVVGESEMVDIDVDHCWRCEVAPVPREDDVGLCSGCANYLRAL